MNNLLTKIFLLLFLCSVHAAHAQLYPVSLDQKIDQSTSIILGKVLKQRPYKDAEGNIYTANLIQVNDTYKGAPGAQIVITTKGGALEDQSDYWPHALHLRAGQEGIFFLTDSHIEPIKDRDYEMPNYRVYSEQQGFIRFVQDFKTLAQKGVEPFNVYTDIPEQVINPIIEKIGPGPGGPKSIKGRTGVRYHFTHFSLNGNSLTFDIYVNSMFGNKFLKESGIVLSYNQSTFGSNLGTNGNLRLRESGVSALAAYDLWQADLLDGKLSIEMHSNTGSGLANIDGTEQILAKGELKIVNPIFDPKIHVDQSYLNALNKWYDPTSGQSIPFDTVVVTIDAPVSSVPIIESFSPDVVSSGTGTIIEIKGQNFEEYVDGISSVYFTDAEGGPGTLFSTLKGDIISWSPTSITAVVPTVGKMAPGDPILETLIGATGEIGVCNGSMECNYSSTKLTVKFGVGNRSTVETETPSEVSFPISMFGANDEKGFYVSFGANINTDLPAKAAIQRALDTWKCATGLNYTTDPAHPNMSSSNTASIQFGAVDPGNIGETIISSKRCVDNTTGNFVQGVLTKFKYTIDETRNWYKGQDPAGIAADQYDLQSNALHELGHAQFLEHVLQPDQVMWHALDLSEVKRKLKPWDIEGGAWEMSLSSNALNGTSCSELAHPMAPANTSGLPCSTLVSTDKVVLEGTQLNVSPNPFENTLNMTFGKLESPMKVTVKLYDLSGKLRFFSEERFEPNGVQSIDLGNLQSGMYFLNLVSETGQVETIKVFKM